MVARLVATAVLVTLLSGCAFTVHDVTLNYSYQPTGELPSGLDKLKLGHFTDGRDVENPRMIMNQRNLYGDTTSGGWQAEKPLSEIVRDAVNQAVSAHQQSANDNSLELTGELVDFDTEVIVGAWSAQYTGRLTQRFQLSSSATKEIIWRDSFTASATVPSKEGADGLFKKCLDELVDALVQDEYFVQQLNKY